jgi:hypothetical protein
MLEEIVVDLTVAVLQQVAVVHQEIGTS